MTVNTEFELVCAVQTEKPTSSPLGPTLYNARQNMNNSDIISTSSLYSCRGYEPAHIHLLWLRASLKMGYINTGSYIYIGGFIGAAFS